MAPPYSIARSDVMVALYAPVVVAVQMYVLDTVGQGLHGWRGGTGGARPCLSRPRGLDATRAERCIPVAKGRWSPAARRRKVVVVRSTCWGD